MQPTPHIDVDVRHSANCKPKDNRYDKKCGCRKCLYIKSSRKPLSARTRSWTQAVKTADKLRLAKRPTRRSVDGHQALAMLLLLRWSGLRINGA